MSLHLKDPREPGPSGGHGPPPPLAQSTLPGLVVWVPVPSASWGRGETVKARWEPDPCIRSMGFLTVLCMEWLQGSNELHTAWAFGIFRAMGFSALGGRLDVPGKPGR